MYSESLFLRMKPADMAALRLVAEQHDERCSRVARVALRLGLKRIAERPDIIAAL